MEIASAERQQQQQQQQQPSDRDSVLRRAAGTNASGMSAAETDGSWVPDAITRDFIDKELKSSDLHRQLRTLSTLICCIQVSPRDHFTVM